MINVCQKQLEEGLILAHHSGRTQHDERVKMAGAWGSWFHFIYRKKRTMSVCAQPTLPHSMAQYLSTGNSIHNGYVFLLQSTQLPISTIGMLSAHLPSWQLRLAIMAMGQSQVVKEPRLLMMTGNTGECGGRIFHQNLRSGLL